MKLPIKKIRVLTTTWDVVPIVEFHDETLMGEMDGDKRTLTIKATLAKEAALETIIHETVHAYQEVNHMDTAWTNEDRRHEYFAQWTTVLILDLVRNNRELIRKIWETDGK